MAGLGFLHTASIHVDRFEGLVKALAPQCQTQHLVNESLLTDAISEGLTNYLAMRVAQQVRALIDAGADCVVCTCSTIGGLAESVDQRVIRIDRPLAVAAVQAGQNLLLLAAVESTLVPTMLLIEDVAAAQGRFVRCRMLLVAGAWAYFQAGDLAGYEQQIVRCMVANLDGVDAVVLAQASMDGVPGRVQGTQIPVLSSPMLGVRAALVVLGYALQAYEALPNAPFSALAESKLVLELGQINDEAIQCISHRDLA